MKTSFLLSLVWFFALATACTSGAQQRTQNDRETITPIRLMQSNGATESDPRAARAAQVWQQSLENYYRLNAARYQQDRITLEQDLALYAKIDSARRDCYARYNDYLSVLQVDTVSEVAFWQSLTPAQTEYEAWDGEIYNPDVFDGEAGKDEELEVVPENWEVQRSSVGFP
jgi:hypothetical protein